MQIHSYNTHHRKVRLWVIFFNNLSPLPLFHSFLVQIHSYNTHYRKVRLWVFFNNLSPLPLFPSFLVHIHSYNTHHPKVRLWVIFFLITYHQHLPSLYSSLHSLRRTTSPMLYVVCYHVTSLTSLIQRSDIPPSRITTSLAAILQPLFCTSINTLRWNYNSAA